MTDTTSPSGTVEPTALTFDAGVDAIENLLSDDPEMDLEGSDEANGSEVESDEDDIELSLDDDEDGEAADVEAKASELSDDTEIVLDDGEKISLAQLKRNNLFQRDYTRKTEELKSQREAMDKEFNERVTQASEELRRQRDFILEYSGQFLPQEPSVEMLRDDPLGYMEAKAVYEQQVKRFSELTQQRENETKAQTEKRQEDYARHLENEKNKLFEALPKLKDAEKRKAFKAEAVDIGGKVYGIPEDEINAIGDHRYLRVFHDALQYRKLLDKKQATKEVVSTKPKLNGNKRMSVTDTKTRDAEGRFQALKKTGSVDAAIRSIMDTL